MYFHQTLVEMHPRDNLAPEAVSSYADHKQATESTPDCQEETVAAFILGLLRAAATSSSLKRLYPAHLRDKGP